MAHHKLLLADDSITVQKVVNLTFADEGIDVVTVGDGDAAIAKLAEFMPDLVLADVNMPGLSGYEVCERIKQNPETANIPVLLLVGSFEAFDDDEALRVGADGHLTKPFQSIRLLVNKVNDLLGGGSSEEAEQVPDVESSVEESDSPAETAVEESDEAVGWSDAAESEMTPDASTEPDPEDIEVSEALEDEEPVADTKAQTLQMERSSAPVFDYGDAGSDDEMIESSSGVEYSSTVSDEEDLGKTQPLKGEELKEFAFVAADSDTSLPEVPADTVVSEPDVPSASMSFDDGNLLDLPPLVEETGIRPAFAAVETEPAAVEVVEPAVPEISEELVRDVTARVVDKLTERIAAALGADIVNEISAEVLKELDQTKEVS